MAGVASGSNFLFEAKMESSTEAEEIEKKVEEQDIDSENVLDEASQDEEWDEREESRKLSANLSDLKSAYDELLSEHKRSLARFKKHMEAVQPLLLSCEEDQLRAVKQRSRQQRRSNSMSDAASIRNKIKEQSHIAKSTPKNHRRGTWANASKKPA